MLNLHCTLSLISSVLERLKPEFLFSDLMALIAPDLISIFACSVAVAVSTAGWSDNAVKKGMCEGNELAILYRTGNAFIMFVSLKVVL